MPSYTSWTWSAPHQRHYSYLLDDDGATVLDTLWSGHHHSTPNPATANPVTHLVQPPASPPAPGPASNTSVWSQSQSQGQGQGQSQSTITSRRTDSVTNQTSPPYSEGDQGSQTQLQYRPNPTHTSPQAHPPAYANPQYGHSLSLSHQAATNLPAAHPNSHTNTQQFPPPLAAHQRPLLTLETLPPEIQATMNYNNRRLIRTGADRNDAEQLDSRYRRVINPHQAIFFVPGRVFKMLWTEPAGQANPGRTRNSTHFSTVWCGEQAYSEIRRFVVVRNKGTFSQCIPVQTYKKRGATKPGLVMHDHGVIHTTPAAPNLMPGENLTKYSIRVEPSGQEALEAESRVNYGKAYAVEHNVKVLDIGMVVEGHRYLIESYFDSAMRGQ